MRALVLGAGYGRRLGALTESTPKPLLDVAGHPLVAIILANLGRQGIRDVAVNLHFHPQVVMSALNDGARFGVRIRYYREPELLGTLGAAKNAESFLSEAGPFLIHYGDVVTDQDFAPLAAAHAKHGALATILVHERPGSNSVAILEPDGLVSRFVERPAPAERADLASDWAFSGVAVLDPGVLDRVPPGLSDLPADLLPALAAEGRLYAVPLSGYRCAVDSADRLQTVGLDVREGRCRTFLAARSGS